MTLTQDQLGYTALAWLLIIPAAHYLSKRRRKRPMTASKTEKEIEMDIADKVDGIAAQVATNGSTLSSLSTAIQALVAPAPVAIDFTPVLAAIADVKAQLQSTPPAAASPPASPAANDTPAAAQG